MGEGGFTSHKLVDDLGQLDNLTAQFQDSETIMMPEDEELNIQQMSKKEKDIAEGLKSYEVDRDWETELLDYLVVLDRLQVYVLWNLLLP